MPKSVPQGGDRIEHPAGRDYAALADELRTAGYLVFKVPDCTIDRAHGRHTLITRSGHCDGREPIPHGLRSMRMGSFGYWASCQCGHSFSDVTWPDDPDRVTPWAAHMAEYGISTLPASSSTTESGGE